MWAAMSRGLWLLFLIGCGSTTLSPLARAHNATGAALLAEGDLERAEANLRLALEYAPSLPEAHLNLGVVALRRGHLAEAEEELRLAVALDEGLGEAWGNLGVVLGSEGRTDEAEAAYVAALRIHPGLAFARRNLARLLLEGGRYTEARAQLLRLLEVDEGDRESQAVLAWCELLLGRPDAGRARVAAAFAPDGEGPAVAHLVRAILALADGDLASAEVDLAAADEDPGLHREVALRRAAIEVITGDHAAAIARLGPLLEADPLDAAAHLLLARAAEGLGEADEAARHARRALELVPGLREAERILGR